tara:strand:- start:4953 stop:6806 length:1854 start_codon:yes stop_codon:yes gene_type:complete
LCGIFGFIGYGKPNFKEAVDVIEHRGPNGDGFLSYDVESQTLAQTPLERNERFKIGFGFRRLSIIDLSHSADQPFSLSEPNLHIIFNGEIYNYKELREELESLGYSFRTHSDTEVLLTSYQEWGEECVHRFNGMWAFAILDIGSRQVFCARDRFGIKPFYYYANQEQLIFGSEIKQFFTSGVAKEINNNVIKDFLENSLVDHTEETFFKNIFQLPAGHKLMVRFDEYQFSYEIERFWKLEKSDADDHLNFVQASKKFKDLLEDSIKLRRRSDVPLGSCLSGGLDSSSIVCLAANQVEGEFNTLTSMYEGSKFDESNYAKMVNQSNVRIKANFCGLTENILVEEIDQLIWFQDEPFGSFSIMAQWEVMKLAKKIDVTVLLDGQGGDELLGGYRKYYAFYLKELIRSGKYVKALTEMYYLLKNRDFNFISKEGFKRYLLSNSNASFLSERGKSLKNMKKIGLSSANSVREKSLEDIEFLSFPALLRYEDRNSMAHSIESRVPFMDYRVVQFAYSTSSAFKIRKGFTKAMLREALKGVLPEGIRTRISKLGFATPQSDWMESVLNRHFKEYFAKMNNPYLDNKYIAEEFDSYPKSDLHSWDFSRFYIFDKWYKAHFSKDL